MRGEALNCYLVALQHVVAVDERDGFAVGEQLRAGLEACIATPNDRHVLVCKERTVAGGTVDDALVLKLRCTRDVELLASGA